MAPCAGLSGSGWAVGVDRGGTAMKAVVVDAAGVVVARLRAPTGASQGPTAVLGTAAGLVEQARGLEGARGQAMSVGIGVPGFVDEAAGVVEFAANLGWRDMPVARLLGERLGLPVVLGHDVRLGGRAEGELGAAVGAGDYLFVALGTGIAAALTLGGAQRRGPTGLAGEIGHVVVEPGGPRCRCGGRGCLEEVASASGIGRRYRAEVPGPEIGSAEVFALANGGDGVARRVVSTAAGYIGRTLAVVQGALQLEVIVLGGGLAKAGPDLLELVGAPLRSCLPCTPAPRLVLAKLGDEAASLGACLLARSSAGTGRAREEAPPTSLGGS